MATDFSVFSFVGETITAATNAFLTPAIEGVVGIIRPVAVAGIALYFTCMGYMMIAGRVESPLSEFILKFVKFGIITFFALTAANFSGYLMNGLNGLEEGLASTFASASTGAPPPSNVYEAVDGVIKKGFDIADDCFNEADQYGIRKMGLIITWKIAGSVIAVCTALLGLAGGISIILAKFLLVLVFAIGPLSVMCLMFPPTQKFFDSWFSQAVTYILTIVMIASVLALGIKTFDYTLSKIDMFDDATSPLILAGQVALVTIILSAITKQVAGLAAGLAGGMAASAISAGQVAMAAVGAAMGAKAVGKWAANKLNPQSEKQNVGKDGKLSGPPVKSSALGHALAGRSIAAPAYRRAAIQRMKSNLGQVKRNWGKPSGGGMKEAA